MPELFKRKNAEPSTPRPEPADAAKKSGRVSIASEKIAQRAYQKWCERGRPEGSAERDWLEAEAELRVELEQAGPGGVRKSR
jgi:Protein of unknown function (DUF2934)